MLNDTLKRLRKARGLTQSQLAEALDVSQSTIAMWEAGTRRPDLDLLSSVADFFGVSADFLLSGERAEPDDPWELRERLRRDPDMRVLFDAAAKASPEHLKAAAAMLKALEPPEDEVE